MLAVIEIPLVAYLAILQQTQSRLCRVHGGGPIVGRSPHHPDRGRVLVPGLRLALSRHVVPGDASSVVSVNSAKLAYLGVHPDVQMIYATNDAILCILEQEGVEFEIVVVLTTTSVRRLRRDRRTMLRPETALRNEPRLGPQPVHTNRRPGRAADYQFAQMVTIGCSPEPCRHSRRFEDPSAGMAFAPDMGWRDRPRNGTAGSSKFVSASCVIKRNHGPSLVLQMVLHGAKEIGSSEPTAVIAQRHWRWTPVVFAPISTSSSMCGLLASG